MKKYNFNSLESHLYTNINHIGREVRVILRNAVWVKPELNKELTYVFGKANLRPSEFKLWNYSQEPDGDTINDLIRFKLLAIHFCPETQQELEGFKQFHKDVLSRRVLYGRTTVLFIDITLVQGCKADEEFLESLGLVTTCPELTANFYPDFTQDIELSDILGASLWDSVYLNKRKEPEHVCFLDVDGVLQPTRSFVDTNWQGSHAGEYLINPVGAVAKFDRVALTFLKKLATDTNLSFVLSSQWRITMDDEDVKAFGRYLGLPIIGKVVNGGRRPAEIAKWMQDNTITGKAFSLDDESFQVEGVKEFHIKAGDGIRFSDMANICNYLGTDLYNFTNSRFIQHHANQETII